MGIEKYLDLSTCHITQQDSEILDSVANNPMPDFPVVYGYEYGWFIPVGEQIEYPQSGLSDSFAKVMRYAKKHGCALIRLDCDAPTLDTQELDGLSYLVIIPQ